MIINLIARSTMKTRNPNLIPDMKFLSISVSIKYTAPNITIKMIVTRILTSRTLVGKTVVTVKSIHITLTTTLARMKLKKNSRRDSQIILFMVGWDYV